MKTNSPNFLTPTHVQISIFTLQFHMDPSRKLLCVYKYLFLGLFTWLYLVIHMLSYLDFLT